MKYLIINADDFGLSSSVNRGVIETFECGNITSASLMVNMPGFRDAIRLAERYPELSVGLHFNLTYGEPVSLHRRVHSLTDSHGRFSYANEWQEQHIQAELCEQWDRFCLTGLRPTHIDSHQLIQNFFPLVYRCMSNLSKTEDVPMRLTSPKPSTHPMTTDYLIGSQYDSIHAVTELKSTLNHLNHGITELYCHPGYVDKDVRRFSSWTTIRQRELSTFKRIDMRRVARERGIELINYRDLHRMRNQQ